MSVSYSSKPHNPETLKLIVKRAKIDLTPIMKSTSKKIGFAFRGTSGALVAPILAHQFNTSCVVVRKPTEERHSSLAVEYSNDLTHYIIVDDFISSGKTIKNIKDDIKTHSTLDFIGVWLYQNLHKEQLTKGVTYEDELILTPAQILNPVIFTKYELRNRRVEYVYD
jgi:orotate phosphoribosyltransferase-like protein